MGFKHTEETDARIRRGYEAGERVLDMARELGVTRNVIIGRARRIGLAEPGRQFTRLVHIPTEVRSAAARRGWEHNEARRAKLSDRSKRLHRENADAHKRIITALRAGYDRYVANRKANHSTALLKEPAE